jgi:hypothetical protein
MKKITLIPIICVLLVFAVGYVERGEIIQKEGIFGLLERQLARKKDLRFK